MENQVNKHGTYWYMLSQEDWKEVIKNKLNTTNFKIIKSSTETFSDALIGFMGVHLFLHASVAVFNEKGEDSQNLNINFFAKSKPRQIKEFVNFVEGCQGFFKEYRFLLEILPDLKKHRIQEEWSSICKCYLAKPEILVLENLMSQGFQHFDSRECIDYKHCVILVETLARFHAESVIFEEMESCTIGEKHSDILFETIWVNIEGHVGYDLAHAGAKTIISLLEHQPDYNTNQEKYKIVKEKYLEVFMETSEFVKPSKKYRNVICHGDLWSNNILFRYGDNGEPNEVRLVDFQLFRYNPPAHDIMTFLYFVSNRNFRDTYLDEILKIYYKTFSSELKKHGLNPDELQFSWSEFKESCEFYQRASQIVSVFYTQNSMMNKEYLKKTLSVPEYLDEFMRIDKSKYILEKYLNDSKYRERYHEVMQEMFECCILNQQK